MLALVFVTALVAALVVTPLVVRQARKWGLLDVPCERRVHTSPVPRVGGVAVFLATVAGLCTAAALSPSVLHRHSNLLLGVSLGGLVMFAAGLWDDLRGLSARHKLLGQVAAAGVVCLFGFRIDALKVAVLSPEVLAVIGVPLTMLWIVAITNAFNLIDGLDGLATGIAIVALGTTGAIALAVNRFEVALVAAALLGSLVGFLRYNVNPARIFLGDSGSLFVGFMLAVLSVSGSTKASVAVLATVPLFTLALPLLDTLLAVARRWLRGTSFATADRRHIHHRLLARGLTPRRAAVVLYVAAAALASLGLMIALAPPERVWLITGVGGLLSLVLLVMGLKGLDYHEFSEAGQVIAVAPRKLRRILQDRIYANDLAMVVRTAGTIDEANAVLEDAAPEFGFVHMELCNPSAVARRALARGIDLGATWWAVFPLRGSAAASGPVALVIWCRLDGSRPRGTERVARILSPVISTWLGALPGAPAEPGQRDAALAPGGAPAARLEVAV